MAQTVGYTTLGTVPSTFPDYHQTLVWTSKFTATGDMKITAAKVAMFRSAGDTSGGVYFCIYRETSGRGAKFGNPSSLIPISNTNPSVWTDVNLATYWPNRPTLSAGSSFFIMAMFVNNSIPGDLQIKQNDGVAGDERWIDAGIPVFPSSTILFASDVRKRSFYATLDHLDKTLSGKGKLAHRGKELDRTNPVWVGKGRFALRGKELDSWEEVIYAALRHLDRIGLGASASDEEIITAIERMGITQASDEEIISCRDRMLFPGEDTEEL